MNLHDIDIFLITYNRAGFLREALQSLADQTVCLPVTVLDNGSTDNTPEVVESFSKYGFSLSRVEMNEGPFGNFKRAQSMASAAWTIIFHDDDLVHPRYLEYVLDNIRKYPDYSLMGSLKTDTYNPVPHVWNQLSNNVVLFSDPGKLSSFILNNSFSFPTVVYKTEYLKKKDHDVNTFGKISDMPYVLSVAASGIGKSLCINESCLQYRRHQNSDSFNQSTGPFKEQIFALYREHLEYSGSSPFTQSGRGFIKRNFSLLVQSYYWIGKEYKKSLVSYITEGIKNKATTPLCVLYGVLCEFPVVLIRRIIKCFGVNK